LNRVKTLIVTRHGTFEGNQRAGLKGEAAFAEAAKGLGLHDLITFRFSKRAAMKYNAPATP